MPESLKPTWICSACGYEWLQREGVKPTHCASSKCRSRKWNGDKPSSVATVNAEVRAVPAEAVLPTWDELVADKNFNSAERVVEYEAEPAS